MSSQLILTAGRWTAWIQATWIPWIQQRRCLREYSNVASCVQPARSSGTNLRCNLFHFFKLGNITTGALGQILGPIAHPTLAYELSDSPLSAKLRRSPLSRPRQEPVEPLPSVASVACFTSRAMSA